ncbi:hypothetical protein C1878_03710 [Gordonibacter sp. 28C]|uniref:hypothetical protein n=1 Tax=Gordonibacter sp. 28C TaxID=2078569 RepID=UPI000E1504FA|nr:hypothetical protein [Gordonibacter sp. 28C]RDB63905.1 hypothetical protein C1878_03710 [Gordonibacter sp. 28C]
MKKRTIAIAAALMLAVVAVPTIAFANAMPAALPKALATMQETQAAVPAAERAAAPCANFADADNDGVCDNCDATAQGTHHRGYVDADSDGVCDNYAAGVCPGNGQGGGCGNGGACGQGAGQGQARGGGHHGRGC